MKKIENMNFKEAKEAFSNWEVKHPRLNGFDMSGLSFTQCGKIASGTDREATYCNYFLFIIAYAFSQ